MKVIAMMLCMVLVLSGCGGAESFETLTDVYSPQAPLIPRQTAVMLPQEAAVQTLSSEYGTLYLCDGYELAEQILPSGDLDATLRTVTGYGKQQLTWIETKETDHVRYICAWSSAGEGGEAVGRAAVLDDGCFHYCLSVMAPAEGAGALAQRWQAVLGSYGFS